jgi:hypothetical protein
MADPARAVVELTSTSPLELTSTSPLDSVGRERASARHAAASREAALLTSLGLVENLLGGTMRLRLHRSRRRRFYGPARPLRPPGATLSPSDNWSAFSLSATIAPVLSACAACLILLAAPAMPILSAISLASFPLLVRNRIVDVLQRPHETQFSSSELPLEDADIFPSIIRRVAWNNAEQIIVSATESFRLSHDLEMQ